MGDLFSAAPTFGVSRLTSPQGEPLSSENQDSDLVCLLPKQVRSPLRDTPLREVPLDRTLSCTSHRLRVSSPGVEPGFS